MNDGRGGAVVLKLGGSVVTEKSVPETVDEDALDAVTEAIAERFDDSRDEDRTTTTRLVLVHGGGSFGHHHAAEHGITPTAGSHDGRAVHEIHHAMKRLNAAVLERLHDSGVPALPVHPLSAGSRNRDGELGFPIGQVETMLAEGFVPVLHGDVISHRGEGATIVSGDELVVSLGRDLEADRVGLCSAVPGVLDSEGSVIPAIDEYEAVADALGASDTTDVTGGMAAKVRALLELPVPAYVFGIDALAGFLDEEPVGTRIG